MHHLSDNLHLLAQSALFRDLDESQLAHVLEASSRRQFADKTFVFMEEDPATHVYLIARGRVKLTQVSADGQQVLLGYLGKGSEFGVIAALNEITYPVSAQASGDCRALAWERAEMQQLMAEMPAILHNALYIMAGQIRYFQNRIRELSTQRVERRIARTLLRLAQQSGRKVEQGVLIDLPLTRQDLAEMTGTTLFTVSRVLKAWETKGLVQSLRERVIICFPHGLVTIAEDYGPIE